MSPLGDEAAIKPATNRRMSTKFVSAAARSALISGSCLKTKEAGDPKTVGLFPDSSSLIP